MTLLHFSTRLRSESNPSRVDIVPLCSTRHLCRIILLLKAHPSICYGLERVTWRAPPSRVVILFCHFTAALPRSLPPTRSRYLARSLQSNPLLARTEASSSYGPTSRFDIWVVWNLCRLFQIRQVLLDAVDQERPFVSRASSTAFLAFLAFLASSCAPSARLCARRSVNCRCRWTGQRRDRKMVATFFNRQELVDRASHAFVLMYTPSIR